MLRKVVSVTALALALAACGGVSQEVELKAQLQKAGYAEVKAFADYDTSSRYDAKKKRTITTSTLDDYEADAKVGACAVHIEQDEGKTRYVVESVNDHDVSWPNLDATALRKRAKQDGIYC